MQNPATTPTPANDTGPDLTDDLLQGAANIADFLGAGFTADKVYHMHRKGQVPIHNVAGIGLCARRSALREFFDSLTAPRKPLDRNSRQT